MLIFTWSYLIDLILTHFFEEIFCYDKCNHRNTYNSRVKMVRSVNQISGQLFWHLIIKIYEIWWLLALGVPRKSLSNFFYVPFREWGFRRLTFLKGEKSTLSNMVILYIIGMQILYWFKNTKESTPENSCFRRIHGIIDSIRKSYLFSQAKKQNYGVFWNSCSVGILKDSLPGHTKMYFFVSIWIR